MDADLFSPADAAALLAIRAVIADHRLSPAEMEAMFASMGLTGAPTPAKQAPTL